MVFSTCENIGGSFESLRGRFYRNGRIPPIGRLGVTFLIGRLELSFSLVKYYHKKSVMTDDFAILKFLSNSKKFGIEWQRLVLIAKMNFFI